jgi:hypothetical protein
MKNYTSKFSFFILTVLALYACHKKSTPNQIISTHQKIKSLDVVLDTINYKYYTCKSKIETTDNNGSVQVNALIRCAKDSVLWVSLSKSSIEGARGLYRPDSIFVLDRMNNIAYLYSSQSIYELISLPITYSNAQSLLIGELIFKIDSTDIWQESTISNDSLHVVLKQNRKQLVVYNFINKNSRKVEGVLMKDSISNQSAQIEYKDFVKVDSFFVPHSIDVIIHRMKNQKIEEQEIHVKHNKIEFANKGVNFPFNVPKKYEIK